MGHSAPTTLSCGTRPDSREFVIGLMSFERVECLAVGIMYLVSSLLHPSIDRYDAVLRREMLSKRRSHPSDM